jgi:hypothetical protein
VFEIGSSLREARLRQSLDFGEVEQAIKIRGKYLRALEEEQFETLPAETYVKGFLRAYADYLGLDGQLYVDEFNSRYIVGEEEVVQPRRRHTASRQRAQRRVARNVVVATLVGIAALTGLVIAAWKFGSSPSQGTAFTTLANTPKTPSTIPAVLPQATPKPHRTRRVRLVLTAARGSCWLQVHAGSATGRPLYQGTLEQGQTQIFVARRVWIDAGAPEALNANLNGNRLALPTSGPAMLLVTPRGAKPAPTGA